MKIMTKAKFPANEERLFKIFEKIVTMSNELNKSLFSKNELKGFFDRYNNILSKLAWYILDFSRTALIFNSRIIHKKQAKIEIMISIIAIALNLFKLTPNLELIEISNLLVTDLITKQKKSAKNNGRKINFPR